MSDYFTDLERALRLATRQGRHRPWYLRFRASGRGRRQMILGVGVTVVLAGGAVAGAVTSLDDSNLTVPAPNGVAPVVQPELAAALAVLRTPRTSRDDLPAIAVQEITADGGLGQHYGVNSLLSRLAGTTGGSDVWLIPGSAGSCLYIEGAQLACSTNADVIVDGIWTSIVDTTNGHSTDIGIAPDGGSVSVTQSSLSPAQVTRSGAIYTVTGGPSNYVTEHTPTGTAFNVGPTPP